TDSQPLGLRGHPGGDAHCLPNAFVGQSGRLEVVDERYPGESAGFGLASALDNIGDRHPHLRQEQVPLRHYPPTIRIAEVATPPRLTFAALVYYFYYFRGLMDVGLNSGQLALRDSVRDVLRAECPPATARQAMTDPDRWRTVWKTVVDLGWSELAVPTADGDSSFGRMDLTVVLEECGAALAPVPLLSSVGLAAGLLRLTGPAVDDVLAEIGNGVVAALAVHPPGHRLPGVPMTLQDGRVHGRAVAVPGLPRSELVVTLASSADGPVAAVVRVGDGVAVHEAECTDPAQPVADIEVNARAIAIAPVALESALATPLVAAAADLVGVAGAALDRATEYAKTRQQFGKPIGAFQGIKHALADNYVALERARGLTYAAAARLDDPSTPAAEGWNAAALAKAAAADAAVGCGRTGVQVHGALAQTWEHDMHLYLRHAWQGASTLGDSRALYHAGGRRFAGSAA